MAGRETRFYKPVPWTEKNLIALGWSSRDTHIDIKSTSAGTGKNICTAARPAPIDIESKKFDIDHDHMHDVRVYTYPDIDRT